MTRCLVIGGGGELGRAVCRQLASAGARVALTYHQSAVQAAELASELEAETFDLDLRRVEQIGPVVEAAVAALGGLDALITCAGLGAREGFEPTPGQHQELDRVGPADWEALMAVNVTGPFYAAQAAIAAMRAASTPGNLVFVGSIEGVKPVPTPVHYAATKAALTGMTRAMAKETGPDDIRVNVVAPGVLEGGSSRLLPQQTLDAYLKHSALSRFGSYAEIAAMIAWLALHNTYLTGQTLGLDGGL